MPIIRTEAIMIQLINHSQVTLTWLPRQGPYTCKCNSVFILYAVWQVLMSYIFASRTNSLLRMMMVYKLPYSRFFLVRIIFSLKAKKTEIRSMNNKIMNNKQRSILRHYANINILVRN